MKLLIAIDLGDVSKFIKDAIIVGAYDPNYRELTLDETKVLPIGTTISFDEAYLRTDREDDSFKEAEFYGIIE